MTITPEDLRDVEDVNHAHSLYREAEGTPRAAAAYKNLERVVARVKRRSQRGAASAGALAVFAMVAITVLATSILIIGLWALGLALLSPREERERRIEREVWRAKKRELNASVDARRVR